TSFLAVVVCVGSPFFRVKWLILPGQPVTPRKRYSIRPLCRKSFVQRKTGGLSTTVVAIGARTPVDSDHSRISPSSISIFLSEHRRAAIGLLSIRIPATRARSGRCPENRIALLDPFLWKSRFPTR